MNKLWLNVRAATKGANTESTPLLKASATPKSVARWNKTAKGLGIAAEVSNIGIALQVISNLVPPLLAVAGPFIPMIELGFSVGIYCFRNLRLATRIVGRSIYKMPFEGEVEATPQQKKKKSWADFATAICFSLTIGFLVGAAILTSPLGTTLAWTAALAGLCIVGNFDYRFEHRQAKKKLEQAQNNSTSTLAELKEAEKDLKSKRDSKRLFMALLVGLSVLLICGSAAVFAPPLIAPILLMASQGASAYLGLIAVCRLGNWLKNTGILSKWLTVFRKNKNALVEEKQVSLSTTAAAVKTYSAETPKPKTQALLLLENPKDKYDRKTEFPLVAVAPKLRLHPPKAPERESRENPTPTISMAA